jgi:hypothetical protein
MSREACIELARTLGVDVDTFVEQWQERAAIREFEGGLSRADAERAALEDLRLATRIGPRSVASPHSVATKKPNEGG